MRTSPPGLDRKRLRLWLGVFFLALAIPTGILIRQAFSELKWEAFHQQRLLAEELAARIDDRFGALMKGEEARSFTDYGFLVLAGDPAANFLQRSPLSAYPVASAIPGLIGYFQVDAQGAFSTPLLPRAGSDPTAFGISRTELEHRLALAERLRRILDRNRLVQGGKADAIGNGSPAPGARLRRQPRRKREARPATEVAAAGNVVEQRSRDAATPVPPLAPASGQAAFDRLKEVSTPRQREKKQKAISSLGRVDDLRLDSSYPAAPVDETQPPIVARGAAPLGKREVRKERGALPEPRTSFAAEEREGGVPTQPAPRIHTFESEIDPFEFSLLDSGHWVLFRKVWRDGQRYIQGALLRRQPFLQGAIESAFREAALARTSDLIVAFLGDVIADFPGGSTRDYRSSAGAQRGLLLYRTRLSAPLNDLELIFTLNGLPAGPGSELVTGIVAILASVLLGGFYLMYRLGMRQIDLARQQQDFVSAVSHELKTPLTSIRMYGEMLRAGWAPEEKKKTYYDYIYAESERLSRLIANVLQLARMTRNDLGVDLKPLAAAELMDGIRSKVASQVERAGFELQSECEGQAARTFIQVDSDYFTQIFINLIDNAIKFSAGAKTRLIDIGCHLQPEGRVRFSVRDYGRGVPSDQRRKIFDLFYRSENELTRETVGTGIGLALVQHMAAAMGGRVEVVNSQPGAEFRVSFPSLR